MIVDELEKLRRRAAISHWDLGIEKRTTPIGPVEIEVYQVFLPAWDDRIAAALLARFRALQHPNCPHTAVIVHSERAHISVPLG